MNVPKANRRVGWKKAIRRGYEFALSSTRFLPWTMPLAIQSRHCGLFGDIFMTLNGLRLAEQSHLPARITWGPESLYFDANRGGNAWEYYFEQSSFDFRHQDGRKRVPNGYRQLRFLPDAETFPAYERMSIKLSCASAITRWCVPLPDVHRQIDAAASQVLGQQDNLGMHIRLTDAAQGLENRGAVQINEFVTFGRDWLHDRPDGHIFLATDDLATLEIMRREFGNAVSWQNCVRSEDGQSIHGHYDGGVPGSPYQKGLEVILDAWLLARCDHIVRTHSRVSAFSICLNPRLSFTCLDERKHGQRSLEWLWN